MAKYKTVVIVVPTYGSKDSENEAKTFLFWVHNHRKKFLKMGYNVQSFTVGEFGEDQETKGKGAALKEAFEDIEKHYGKDTPFSSLRKGDIVICIDGNQIPFDYSFKIIESIKKGSDFLTTCRIGGLGIDDERSIIEKFENFLLVEHHNFPSLLPDAQCGCWGFDAKYLKELHSSLTSKGFELELEIMNFFLNKKVIPTFLGIRVGKPENTSFREKDSLNKLKKLCEWLGLTENTLLDLATKFTHKLKISLPVQQIKLLSHSDIPRGRYNPSRKIWRNFKGLQCELKICDKNHFEGCQKFHPCYKKSRTCQ